MAVTGGNGNGARGIDHGLLRDEASHITDAVSRIAARRGGIHLAVKKASPAGLQRSPVLAVGARTRPVRSKPWGS